MYAREGACSMMGYQYKAGHKVTLAVGDHASDKNLERKKGVFVKLPHLEYLCILIPVFCSMTTDTSLTVM